MYPTSEQKGEISIDPKDLSKNIIIFNIDCNSQIGFSRQRMDNSIVQEITHYKMHIICKYTGKYFKVGHVRQQMCLNKFGETICIR